jgi:hypothetical protein
MAAEKLRATLLGVLLATAASATRASAQDSAPPSQAAPAPPAADAAPQDPAKNQARIATSLDGSLVDTHNGDALMLETSGYRRLLQLVNAVAPADATARSTLKLDRAAALKDPDALRGQWVRVQGLLAQVKAERLDQPLDGAVDIWEGVVTDTDGSDSIVFDMLQRPEGFTERRDIVDVEGVFYRTARFESLNGHSIEAPYLIARNVLHVDTSTLPVTGLSGGLFTAVLVGAAVIFLVFRVIMMIRDSGKKPGAGADASRAIRRAAEQHLREARAARKSGSSPSVPPDPPAKAK